MIDPYLIDHLDREEKTRQNEKYESAGRCVNAERVGCGESLSLPISQLFRNQSFCLSRLDGDSSFDMPW